MESWWNERCRVHEGERRKTTLTLVHYISTYSVVKSEGGGRDGVQTWQSPAEDVLKPNYDVLLCLKISAHHRFS